MKILVLSDNFSPESKGGADRVAFDLSKEFAKKDCEVFVVTATQNKEKEGFSATFGRLKVNRIYVPYYHERWRSYLSLYNPKAIKKVKRIFEEIKPDITHAHNVHQFFSYYSLKLAKKHSRAVFLTAHDVMSFHYGKLNEFIDENNLETQEKFNYKITAWQQIKRFKKRYNPFRNIIIRYYLKYIDKIIAVSQTLKDALNQNGIDNVSVIHNGINVEDWQISQNKTEEFKERLNLKNKKVVLFGGRLSPLKGGNKIIEAMELVSREVSDAVLLTLGKEDKYTQKMKQLAQEKGVRLILTGWIEKDELKAAYWASDLVVTPSIYLDSFNLINIEAMACKKPVVGTCFGGTSEIIKDEVSGYIINPFNVYVTADKILELLKNDLKRIKFGERGSQGVKEKFNLSKQANKYLKFFDKNLKKYKTI